MRLGRWSDRERFGSKYIRGSRKSYFDGHTNCDEIPELHVCPGSVLDTGVSQIKDRPLCLHT